MSTYFFDTSALVKHYRKENGSEFVDSILANPESDVIISEIAIIEMTSALRRLHKLGEISDKTFTLALKRFTADTEGVLLVSRFRRNWINSARELVLQHDLRTLDALQLASALADAATTPIFVAADEKLLTAAQANGLQILNPLTA